TGCRRAPASTRCSASPGAWSWRSAATPTRRRRWPRSARPPADVSGGRLPLGLEAAPAAGAVVGDDLPEQGGQRGPVDRLSPPEADGAGGLVVVAGGDDALGIGDDAAVVDEDVDVVLRRQQGADVPV